jgi:hypothetical protein
MLANLKTGTLKFLEFANCLDDDSKKLSPVKINAWGANIAVFSTFAATVFGWTGGHLQGIESLWGGTMTWLAQAHVVHHFDKRERNINEARLIQAGGKDV